MNPEANKNEIYRSMEALRGIVNNPIGLIELNSDLDIETVTEIFIRINVRKLPMIYLLRCHQAIEVGNRLYVLLGSIKSKNSIVMWHKNVLIDQLNRWLRPKRQMALFAQGDLQN